MSTKILVIDDEQDVLDFISYNLKKEGYTIQTAQNGLEGVTMARKYQPDLILLDVMMPDMDGIEVCRQLRGDESFDKTMIAFLTARGEDYTQIAALDQGGDDFIVKPIKPSILKSRIQALIRRSKRVDGSESQTVELGPLTLDREKYQLIKDETVIEMAKKEFQILDLLMSYPGKVFSREEIFRKIWGGDIIVGERTIDVHIRRIREKIGGDYIKTLKGIGYKIEA